MTNRTEQVDDDKIVYTDKDIFLGIWFSPRKILKYINDNNYDTYTTILLVLVGISKAFDRAVVKDMGDSTSIWAILGICIFFGGLLGWISIYIYAAMLSWTGKLLKGQGDTNSLLRIMAYGFIPSVFGLLFLTFQISVYGVEMFKSDGDIYTAGIFFNIIFYTSLVFELVLGLFTIIFCVIGISEVQKLSIPLAIVNVFLPIIILGTPLLLIFLFN